jgi:transcriptional regulator with XRE-family HTH domain
MDRSGISMDSLADAIGVTTDVLEMYIDGELAFDSGTLCAIAKFFGRKYDYFLEI